MDGWHERAWATGVLRPLLGALVVARRAAHHLVAGVHRLGVMSLVAMQSVSSAFGEIFARDPRATIGGDAVLYQPGSSDRSKAEVGPAQQFTAAQIAQLGRWQADGTIAAYSLEAETQAGILKPEGASRIHLLYSVLGVDPATFPLVGQMQLREPGLTLAQALHDPGSAAITRDVAADLGLSV